MQQLSPDAEKRRCLLVALNQAPSTPGSELPNHGTILAQRLHRERDHGNEYIVLAVTVGYQPFVVWRREVGVERLATGGWRGFDACFSGDYYTELADAIAGYEERPG